MARTRNRLDEGSALILVLCAVALLSLMVATFAATTRLERRASRNYTDGERARLLAWSGVERAKFELRRGSAASCYPLPWLAYYTDSTTAPPPLEQAKRPSLRVDLSPAPKVLASATSTIPWPSGTLGTTYYHDPDNRSFGGDYYVLRVIDNNAQVFLNDANPHLGKMLDNLARATGAPGWSGLGSRVLAGRPSNGFRRVEELRFLLASEDYEKISPFVCCAARVDRKVVECGEQPVGGGGSTKTYRHSRLVFQPRAPIDVNLAPFPVLVAALAGIGCDGAPGAPKEVVSFEKASALASAIIKYRQDPTIVTSADLRGDGGQNADPTMTGSPGSPKAGFQKWAEMARFLQQTGLLPARLQSAVLANANPNTDLNKLAPDLAIYRPVDKYDVTAATTELCFASGGIFTIESLGIMLGPDAEPVAQVKVRSVVRIFERYLETTQRDFEQDRVDPSSPSEAPTLRDMTTLPEFRNVADSSDTLSGSAAEAAGVRAADCDGQVTFNVITEENVSGGGAFVGFLGRDLSGRFADTSSLKNLGSARGDVPAGSSPAGMSVLDASRFDGGSDLQPFGCYVGRDSRYLAFQQSDEMGSRGVMETVSTTIPSVTIRGTSHKLSGGGGGFVPFTSVPRRRDLLGPPKLGRAGLGGFARFAGGGGGGGGGAAVATIPSWEKVWINAHTFELWFKPAFEPGSARQVLLAWESGKPQTADMNGAAAVVRSVSATMTWGAKAHGTIWLEPVPGSNPPELTLKAELKLDKTASTSSAFDIVFTAPAPVRAGTWHHASFGFYCRENNPGGKTGAYGPKHVQFFADGREVTAYQGSDPVTGWPTEIDLQPRILAKVVLALASALGTTPGDLFKYAPDLMNPGRKYRNPVTIPPGSEPVRIGLGIGPDGSNAFRGLVDNIIFQGGWAKQTDDVQERFDTFRPSIGRAPSFPADPQHLTLRKHTPALEWDRPIQIVSYEWTAWKDSPNGDGTYVDIGKV